MIVFLSDNGGQQSWNAPDTQYNGRYAAHTRLGDNTPLRGWKKDLYEGGIRVPAFINWPEQLEAGHRVDVPTHVLDLSATLLEQAGAEPPADLDGTSIWPLLTGPSAPSQWHDRRFYWRQSDLQAVREGDWKLIAPSPDLEGLELYNLAEDPHETNDLADQRSDKREALRQQLEAWPW
jgi:arylsulfatase A-like enzyme